MSAGWRGLAGRRGLAGLVGAAVIALGARLSFPLPGIDLPQTAQTLAVLLVGAALGARSGGFAVLLYIVGGALGLPIFADGHAGLDTVLGPSSGYLLGFIAAAVLVGAAADRDRLGRPRWHAVAVPLAGHGILLLVGGALLVPRVGVEAAWSDGVAPFLPGAIVKSLLAAGVILLAGARWPLRLSAETDAPHP